MRLFVDERHQSAHDGFVRWIDRYYDTGYVVNTKASRGPMIHRARCGHFKHGNKSHSLTATPKVCFQKSQRCPFSNRRTLADAEKFRRCPDCM